MAPTLFNALKNVETTSKYYSAKTNTVHFLMLYIRHLPVGEETTLQNTAPQSLSPTQRSLVFEARLSSIHQSIHPSSRGSARELMQSPT